MKAMCMTLFVSLLASAGELPQVEGRSYQPLGPGKARSGRSSIRWAAQVSPEVWSVRTADFFLSLHRRGHTRCAFWMRPGGSWPLSP